MRAWIARQLRRVADRIAPQPILVVFGRDYASDSARQRQLRAQQILADARKEFS